MSTVPTFVPASSLEQKIHAGDLGGVIALLRSMSHKDRHAHRAPIRAIRKQVDTARWEPSGPVAAWWGGKSTQDQIEAARAAVFFCGDKKDRADESWSFDHIFPHVDLLEPDALRTLAADMVDHRPASFSVAQRLILAGHSERPASDNYIIGLIGAMHKGRADEQNSILRHVAADPGLLDGPVMRVFEVEGTGDTNLASADKYTFGNHTWSYALVELIGMGKLDRAQLIERCMFTLEKDWPQFRAGWFSRFHATLSPTLADMLPLRDRYLGLCHSRIAPTVTLALAAIAALFKEGHIQGGAMLDALTPALSSAVKGQVDTALKLLDQVVKRDKTLAHQASTLACRALTHESPDLHKKAIARIAAWGFDAATGAELASILPHVSAANQGALSALIGAAPLAAPADAMPQAPVRTGVMSPLDPSRKLVPITDFDELVQTIALVFENDIEVDEFERALDALARMAPALGSALPQLSPVIKRAAKLPADHHTLGRALALALTHALAATFASADANGRTSDDELTRRIADLTGLIACQSGLSALSAATHKRGFIDPMTLASRIEAHASAGIISSLDEQVRAILRLPAAQDQQVRDRFGALPQSPFVLACRHALGDDVFIGNERALYLAAARIRHPGQDDPKVFAAYGDMGPDGALAARYTWLAEQWKGEDHLSYHLCLSQPQPAEDLDSSLIAMHRGRFDEWRAGYFCWGEGSLLYAASIVPASLEAFFASGAFQIGFNADWWEARWHDKAYLNVLSDPTVPATPSAVKMMALALGGKEPGQTALAVDVFVTLLLEQRMDAQAVAHEIRWFVLGQMGKNARYAKSLGQAARAHPALPAAVVTMLCIMLDTGDAPPPKDTAGLLDLLLELVLSRGLGLPAGARDAIAILPLTGKGKAAQKELLARLQ
jgi:hypothetical protein